MSMVWPSRYAARMEHMTGSVIRELLAFTQRPDVISFAGGLPAAEYFPTQRVREACAKVLTQQPEFALQYGPTEGYVPLREMIVDWMCANSDLCITPENVLITSGSQQALSMLGALFIDPGDRVLVERPTYMGALQAFTLYQATYVGVPTDADGICTDQMPEALAHDPKFMYILPTFQNPAGVTISRKRRMDLVQISRSSGVPMVEDDPYGALRYEGEDLPSLIALDAKANSTNGHSDHGHSYDGHNYDGHNYDGSVIYLSTFSKTLTPGLRVAWIVAPRAVIERLIQIKQSMDLHTSTFNQMVVHETARDGFIEEHVATLRQVYRQRRDAMLGALDRWAPSDVTWTEPEGGLFLWMKLPEGSSDKDIFQAAIAQNVAFVPGSAFFTSDPRPTARLNFSCMSEDRIDEGIKRLCNVIRECQSLPTS